MYLRGHVDKIRYVHEDIEEEDSLFHASLLLPLRGPFI